MPLPLGRLIIIWFRSLPPTWSSSTAKLLLNSVTESTNNDEVETSETVDESTVVESEKQTLDDAESMPVEEEEVDIQIIEVSSGATPEELSPLVNIEATQIVGDLMSLGIMQSMNSPLQDSEIEKLLEKYDLIPEIVERVEVKIDWDQWRVANLGPALNNTTWRQWWLDWDPEPGKHKLQVRAINKKGDIQTSVKKDVLPNGAQGWHTITVFAE